MSNIRLKNSIEKKELLLKEAALKKQLSIVESLDQFGRPSFGVPAELPPLWNRRLVGLKNQRQDSSFSIQTIQDLDRIRGKSCILFEQNPNARAVITGLRSFVIGSGLTAKAQPKKKNKNKKLAEQVNEFLGDFSDSNHLWEWWSESFTRAHVHGELFLELTPTEECITQIRALEPDFIQTPLDADATGEWSWGVLTDPRDTQNVRGYNLRLPSFQTPEMRDEFIEPQFVKHLKLNVNMNQKRGVPSLMPCFIELEGMDRLRYVSREGLKVRESIAYIQQFANSTESVVSALADKAVTDSYDRYNSQGDQRTIQVEQLEPGSVPRIPESLEFMPPPQSSDAEAAKQGIRSAAEAISARMVVPVWLVLGSDEGGSYASSLTSESPFVKRSEYMQMIFTRYWRDVLESVVQIGIEQNILPTNTLDVIDISVTAPSVNVRNKKDLNETYKLLSDESIMSKQTWSVLNDLEWDVERANIEEEKELNLNVITDFQRVDNEPETNSGIRNHDQGEVKTGES